MTNPWRLSRLSLLPLLLAGNAAFAQAENGKAARFYEDALRRYEKHDLSGAIIQLKNALQVDKSQLSVHMLLGKALLANGEAASAEIELTEALRLGVSRDEVVVPLARALVNQGKQPLLFEQRRFDVAGLSRNVQLQLLLVRASASSDIGDTRGAFKAIEDARAIDPADASVWVIEVPLRIRARQFAEATAAADQALKLAPDSSEAVYQKGSIAHVQGQIQPALSAYERALKLDSTHVEARIARVGILLDLRRDKEAQTEVKDLLTMAPFDPRVPYLDALLSERAGNNVAAKASLKKVTELLDPAPIEFVRFRPQALMLNGMAHYGLGELEKAKPYLEQAQRLQVNSPLAKLLARIYLADANPDRAAEVLEAYLKARPGDGQALLMMASTQMAQGRHARATALMQEALRTKDAPEFHMALGLSLMRSGQNTTALDELSTAFKKDPSQAYAGLALVTLYLQSGQTDKALSVANSLVKTMPQNPSALLVLGLAKARAGDLAGSRSAYEQALKLDASLIQAKLGLAHIEILSKAYDAAGKRLNDILKEDERNVDAIFEMALLNEFKGRDDEVLRWLQQAALHSKRNELRANFALIAWHLRKGENSQALEASKQMLAKAPEDVQVLLSHAGAQVANGDLVGARASLTGASRRAGFEAPTQVEIAKAQMTTKDWSGAAYSLDKALSGMPDYLPAMVLMATVELQQGDPAKSERRARQVIQAQPKLAIGYSLLADVQLRRGQMPAALDSLRRAHETQPSSETLLRLFRSLSTQDNGKKAIDLAERWIKLNPKDMLVRSALANAEARAGNYVAARRGYEAALKLRPNDAEAMNNLANVLLRQKDPGALKVAEQALALEPRNPSLIDTAGWANLVAGNKDKALQLLRDARLREPGNPEIRYHLAAALAQSGRKSEAREELENALKGNQDFESVQDAKNLLLTLK